MSMIRKTKNAVFDLASRFATGSLRDTIVLAGVARSGTGWMGEMLREIPDYKYLSEPFHLNGNAGAREAGLAWRTCVAPGDNRPRLREHLEQVLTGQMYRFMSDEGRIWPWKFKTERSWQQMIEHLSKEKIVVKSIRLHRMLQWMAINLEYKDTLVIIRHPCAVAASMAKTSFFSQ